MRILILDDHRLFLEGVRSILSAMPANPEVVTFSSARSALESIDKGDKYHLALVDLYLPGLDGLAFLQSIRQRRLSLPVIIVSASTKQREVEEALELGALGFIPKHYSAHELRKAIEIVLTGRMYLPDDFYDHAPANDYRRCQTENDQTDDLTNQLHGRRLEVLTLIADGHPNKSIAKILNISEPTVKSHIASLFKLFNVSNRTACVRKAMQLELIKSMQP